MVCDIAGKIIDISHRFEEISRLCAEYSANEGKAELFLALTEGEFLREREIAEGFSDGAIESAAICRKLSHLLAQNGRFLIHAVAVEWKGKGVLFLGRSGCGKSTHAKLWEKCFGATILCGDKPFLSEEDGIIYAHGSPWNGKEGYGRQGRVPIFACCFVEQGRRNVIETLAPIERAERLLSQLFLPKGKAALDKVLCFADRMTSLPFYRLICDKTEEAARVCFSALMEEEK